MAELAALPSSANLTMQRSCFKGSNFTPRNLYFKIVHRKCRVLVGLPSWEACECSSSLATTLKVRRHPKESSLRCWCLGTLINPENALPLNWVPVVDQVLLIASVVFAYMAGVIPSDKAYFNARKNIPEQDAGSANSTSFGSSVNSENQTNSEYAWDEVKRKLVDALDAIEHAAKLDDRVVECENYSSKRPLSLYAVAEGPRLRLLWATLQRLQNEVDNISGIQEVVNREVWLVILSEIIQGSIQPVSIRWLQEELCLENKNQDKALLTRMFERLKGGDTVLQNIKKSGKEDLYVDLLFFLRFGYLRSDCHFDGKLFTLHGIDILEDLVITLADGITSSYLELISVDSNMSSEMNSLDLALCSLSTRALQRLRNEVAMDQWLHQNINSVVSMYEDRFDLCILRIQLLEDSNKNQTEKLRWWKMLTLKKPTSTTSQLRYVVISQLSVPVKRIKELRSLTGWRYYFSLFLELSDITLPLVRAVIAKTIMDRSSTQTCVWVP